MSTFNSYDQKLRLLGNYWQILYRLVPKEGVKPTLSWLKKELKRDKSQLSRVLNELKRHGLVDFKLEGKTKLWHLTEEGSIFVSYLSRAMEEVELKRGRKADVEGELWKVNQLLTLIDDEGLSKELRETLANRLHELVSLEPVLIVEKCDRLKQSLESWIKNPPIDDKDDRIGVWKRKMLSTLMVKLLSDERTKDWVLSLYPDLKNLLNHEKLEIKKWAIRLLGDIARLSNIENQREIMSLFLEMFLDPSGEPVAEALHSELIHIFTTLPEDEKIRVLDYIRGKIKSDDATVKRNAEWILRFIL